MVSTMDERGAAIQQLHSDLRTKFARVANFRFFCIAASFWSAAAGVVGALYAVQLSPILGGLVFLTVAAAFYYSAWRVVPLASEALCRRLGFVCPICGVSLFADDPAGQDSVCKRAECPKCFQRLEPTI
jgi:hypothetical protein